MNVQGIIRKQMCAAPMWTTNAVDTPGWWAANKDKGWDDAAVARVEAVFQELEAAHPVFQKAPREWHKYHPQ